MFEWKILFEMTKSTCQTKSNQHKIKGCLLMRHNSLYIYIYSCKNLGFNQSRDFGESDWNGVQAGMGVYINYIELVRI